MVVSKTVFKTVSYHFVFILYKQSRIRGKGGLKPLENWLERVDIKVECVIEDLHESEQK